MFRGINKVPYVVRIVYLIQIQHKSYEDVLGRKAEFDLKIKQRTGLRADSVKVVTELYKIKQRRPP